MTVKRIWKLVELCLAWTLMLGAAITINERATAQSGQPSTILTTHIQDTIINANGTTATGTVLISWPSFSTAGGSSVPAGSTSVTLGSNGLLSVQLVPNAGSTPMGSYYTVTYHLADGSSNREYWVVPSQSGGTVAVSTIKSSVLPASVAMQTVSKAYVDTAIATAMAGTPADDPAEPYVLKAGDTMTGPLVLPGDPTASLQAADKNYVDTQVAAISSGLNQKVSTVPQATQTVVQPTGTELAVNRLNNVEQASQYATTTSNGIANATASPDCASGCTVVVDPGYASTEHAAPNTWNSKTHVEDQRGGATFESFFNPSPPDSPGVNAARSVVVASTQTIPAQIAAGGDNSLTSSGLAITEEALAGGSNVFPSYIQAYVPYFKSTYSATTSLGTNYTLGQHILNTQQQDCYGVGDCLMGSMYMRASGGFRDLTDEASHPFDFQVTEDNRVFDGACASGCSTGSTVVQISPTANGGTQGEGRYLLDTNPAKIITAGTLIGGSTTGGQPTASFTGTSFPVSTLLELAQTVPTQSNNIQPGTVTVVIATSGVPAGFATNTAALPASSGVACISDPQVPNASYPSNFETATYTVVDASHLQITFLRPHASGATVGVGGLCGYGLEQTVDTLNGIRQVFPVIASTSATNLLYAGYQSPLIGVTGAQSAYANLNLVIASIARTGNVVTVTTAGNLPLDVNGLTMTVQGVTDTSYNGSFAVTTTGPNSLTYASAGANSTSAGGTVSLVTGTFVLYPMAEALSVYNATTKAVDGQMTLAANTVPWAAGDTVEMPHYFQEQIYPDTELVTQYTPRPAKTQTAGILYNGVLGPGVSGWVISNGVGANAYYGNGGTHATPDAGMGVTGIWNRSLDLQAGESAAIAVHCNSHGCGKWNSAYDLFAMDTSVGQDHLNYSPETSTLNFNLRGTSYQFTPQGLTLGTLNVTTLNAGTINGGSGGSVTLGSVVSAINNTTLDNVLLGGAYTSAPAVGPIGDSNTVTGVGAGSAIQSAREMTVYGALACHNVVGNPALGVENGLDTCIGSAAGMSLVTTGFDGSVDNVFLGQKAGTTVFELDSVILTGTSTGMLCGLYSGATQLTNCLAGFSVSQSGGNTILTAVVDGATVGTPATLTSGHSYTLRLHVHSPELLRIKQVFYAMVNGSVESFGNGLVTAPASLVFELRDNAASSNTPVTILYDGAVTSSPAQASFVAVNSVQLFGSIGSIGATRTGTAWVQTTNPTTGTVSTRTTGTAAEGVDCDVYASVTGHVTFWPGAVPVANEIVTISYRGSERAVGRVADAASIATEAAGGSVGTARWLGKVVRPVARSTEDCENAAQAILSFATNRAAAAQGAYTWINPEQNGGADVWPGDVLALNQNGSITDVVVRSVTIAEQGAVPELLTYRIAFANDWAEGLGITLSEAVAEDALLPQTAQAFAPGTPWPVLANLSQLTVVASGTALTVDAGTAPPTGGGFEVRRHDGGFGIGSAGTASGDLVLRSPVRGFSIPRAAADEVFYLRMYDASSPPLYSRFSAAIATQLPLS